MQELEEKLEKRFDEKIKAMKEEIREEIKIMINEMISQNEIQWVKIGDTKEDNMEVGNLIAWKEGGEAFNSR